MKENKILWNLVMVISLFLWGGGISNAAVSGVCSNCHTMHNSQGGTTMGLDDPQSALLLNDCEGCHTTDTDDPLNNNKYPFVKSTISNAFTDKNCLAGGFFAHDDNDGTDNQGTGHSLRSTAEPPGYNSGDIGFQGDWYKGTNTGLGCAGSSGCHGKYDEPDEMKAIKGGHHAPAADVYRILYVNEVGVKGVGADDYEKALIKNVTTATDTSTYAHNVYSANASGEATISELCANCHGDFHGDDDTGTSPFRRHPSDVDIPDDWNLGTVSGVSTNYNDRDRKYNPLGFPAANKEGEPRVTCLSCHRAHGTENDDLLRWAYSTQEAGGGNEYGCLGCHNNQR